MKRLIIIGASAMGRETCVYAQDCGMKVKGFIDSRSWILDKFTNYPPILGSVNEYLPSDEDVFVCAIGEPDQKRKYVTIIEQKGGVFVSVIHPSSYVCKSVTLGKGCIVCPNATITNDSEIGSHVILNVNASINHDNHIGDYATICPGCHLAGRVKVGTGAFVGTGTVIIPDITLGDGVFVAAGATVVKSYASGRLMGTPARQV